MTNKKERPFRGNRAGVHRKKKDDLGSELADVAIYLLGLSQMLGFSLEEEINDKLKINENRHYEKVNKVLLKKGK